MEQPNYLNNNIKEEKSNNLELKQFNNLEFNNLAKYNKMPIKDNNLNNHFNIEKEVNKEIKSILKKENNININDLKVKYFHTLFSNDIYEGNFYNDSYTFIDEEREANEEYLIFVVHGIGQSREKLERILNLRIKSTIKSIYDKKKLFKKKIHVRMIDWKSGLLERTKDQLNLLLDDNNSTNYPKSFIQQVPLDVLFYLNSSNKYEIINDIIQQMNNYFNLVKIHRSKFNGAVSIISHSLGSVIMYDILRNLTFNSKKEFEENIKLENDIFKESMLINNEKNNQHKINYDDDTNKNLLLCFPESKDDKCSSNNKINNTFDNSNSINNNSLINESNQYIKINDSPLNDLNKTMSNEFFTNKTQIDLLDENETNKINYKELNNSVSYSNNYRNTVKKVPKRLFSNLELKFNKERSFRENLSEKEGEHEDDLFFLPELLNEQEILNSIKLNRNKRKNFVKLDDLKEQLTEKEIDIFSTEISIVNTSEKRVDVSQNNIFSENLKYSFSKNDNILKTHNEEKYYISREEFQIYNSEKSNFSKKEFHTFLNKKIYSRQKEMNPLLFGVDHLFFFGSPLSLFLTIHDPNDNFLEIMETVRDFHNVIHPMDPVAYRIEPIIKEFPKSVHSYKLPHWENDSKKNGFCYNLVELLFQNKKTIDESSVLFDDKIHRKRYDFICQEKPTEKMFNVVGFLYSHMNYWDNIDIFYFVIKLVHWQEYNILKN